MYEQKLRYCALNHDQLHILRHGEKEVDEITRNDKSSRKLKSDTWNKEKCALSAVFFNFLPYFSVECLSNGGWLNFSE